LSRARQITCRVGMLKIHESRRWKNEREIGNKCTVVTTERGWGRNKLCAEPASVNWISAVEGYN